MEREEKEAFWLMTSMLYENVSPGSLKTIDPEDRRQVIYFAKLAFNYISEGRLIPKQVLDFIKSKVILSDLRNYINEIISQKESYRSYEKDRSIIRLLLEEIRAQEQVEIPHEDNKLLSKSDMKYLEKLIYGKQRKKDLLFEGCSLCRS